MLTPASCLCGQLIIELADGLRNADGLMGGKSDPYAVVYFNGKKFGKTKIIDNTLHPIWNEDFEFLCEDQGLLKVQVYDHDMFTKDELLGEVEIKLGGADNLNCMLQRQEYMLQDPSRPTEDLGMLILRVEHGQCFTTHQVHLSS